MNNQPPKWPLRFFRWFCDPTLVEDIEGDLLERFEQNKSQNKRATWLMIIEVIRLFRPGIIRSMEGYQHLNNYGMIKNYLTTSFRFIKREKTYSLMNISGLALGIACALILFKIIDHQLSFDKHHDHYANLYRVNNEDVTTEGKRLWRGQTHPLARALRSEFPQINAAMTFYNKEGLIGIPNKNGAVKRYQEQSGIAFVEPEFLDIFTMHFLEGDPHSALDQPGKVILTHSKANKYFDLTKDRLHEAISQPITLENERTVYVSAIIEDWPVTTDFPFEVIFHYDDQDAVNPWYYGGKSWEEYNSATNCYVKLGQTDPQDFEEQLSMVVDKYLPEHTAQKRTYRLQPLADLHYSEQIRRTYAGLTKTKNELTIIGLIGVFLIVTACINFINLSTAQAVKRAKEVGVRKTMGSSKWQLVTQFLTETALITFFAAILGLGLAWIGEAPIETIFQHEVNVDLFSDLNTFYFLGLLIFTITILAGFYPSVVLARMNPVSAVKHTLSTRQSSGLFSLRRALVVFQFTISQVLIIGILILNAQMSYFQNKDLGFNDDSIITLTLPNNDSTNLQVLKNELLAHSSISKVSFGTAGPMSSWKSTNPIFHENIDGDDVFANLKNVDGDYFDLYEMDLIAGEGFNNSSPRNHAVVNRKLTEVLGFTDPADAVGETIQYGRGGLKVQIVGVVEDFHASSLHSALDNVIFAHYSWNIFQAAIKVNNGDRTYENLQHTLRVIENAWMEQYPEHVFDFRFYDEELGKFYQLEESVAKITRIFVVIAVLIGALGLYGLVAFMANQKTKEIGIRKVMGATTWNIWNIFSRELLILLSIAFVIAAPLAYYVMNSWLNYYAYRIAIGPLVFVIAVATSLLIALVTVGYRSLAVAQANPILSLRDE